MVRKEAVKRSRRNLSRLACALLYAVTCLIAMHYFFRGDHNNDLYINLLFVSTRERPFTIWELLWTVAITDLVLKLFTVIVKVVLTMLPEKVVAFQRRVCTCLLCHIYDETWLNMLLFLGQSISLC